MQYRIYPINSRGRFATVRMCTAASDDEAVQFAAAMNCEFGFEVWQGGRKVIHLPATPKSSDDEATGS